MLTLDVFTPWFGFAAVLLTLIYIQRWIHRHLFGVGFLLSREKRAATLVYYLFLLPGVVLHEFSHYIVAYVIGYNAKRFNFFPEAQEDGSLEMGFVQLDEIRNPVFATLVGTAPLISGILVVVWISTSLLGLPAFFAKVSTGDINIIGDALGKLISRTDFFLWTYVLFGVANAMMPNREDRRGWLALGGAFLAFCLGFILIGEQIIIVNLLNGPIATLLNSLTAVFGTVLVLDLVGMGLIFGAEKILERVTGHEVQYQPEQPEALPAGNQTKSVYDLELPVPSAPDKATPAKRPAPALASTAAPRPALSTPTAPPKPALSGGASSSEPARTFGALDKKPDELAKPTAPPVPIGGPPALRPPSPAPQPAIGSTQSPGPAAPREVTPKPTFGTPARPAELPRPRFNKDDYIDGEVVDEDDDEQDSDDEDEK